MAFRHGRKTGVILGTTDVTSFLNEASASISVETAETTTFGNDAKTYIVGLQDGTVSMSGMFDGAAGALDEVVDAALGAEDAGSFFIQQGYAISDGPGLRCQFGIGEVTSYETSSPVGDVVSASLEIQADDGLYSGVTLHNPGAALFPGLQAIGAGTPANTSVDNGVATSNGFVAQLHVAFNTLSGSSTFTVEDSPDNSTWSALGSFATVGATTRAVEQISGTGSVARYVRLTMVAAGSNSVAFAVGFTRL